MAGPALLTIRGLSKTFSGQTALSGVDFEVLSGEVHGLVGENGAGKSTLIKIVAGIYEPDSGTIELDGRTVHPNQDKLPIAFMHQEVGLVDTMTVGENVALTLGFPSRGGLIQWGRLWGQTEQAYAQLNLRAPDPKGLVGSLSPGDKAILGIVRALARTPRLLVLDEPTAYLTLPDVKRLFDALRRLRAAGTSTILVTHRLHELFEIADRVSVLRNGALVMSSTVAGTSPAAIGEAMLGRRLVALDAAPSASSLGEVVAEIKGVVVHGAKPVSFDIRRGEVLGLVGLRGSGHERIGRAICGDEEIERGEINLGGTALSSRGRHVGRRLREGVALLPADRQREGVFSGMTISENLFPSAATRAGGWHVSVQGEKRRARSLVERFGIRPPDSSEIIDHLSGGNQQRVLLARWFAEPKRLLVIEEPTAGVDVGAKFAIAQYVRGAADKGQAVLIVSSDFEEVAMLCDRVLVFVRGATATELAGKAITEEHVAMACMGAGGHASRVAQA